MAAAVSIALPDLAFAQGQVARLNVGISTYSTKQNMVAGFTNHVSDMILSVVRIFQRAH